MTRNLPTNSGSMRASGFCSVLDPGQGHASESTRMVPLSGKSVLLEKGEPQVSWFSRLPHWLKRLFGQGHADDDDPATEEFATLSSFTLLPGQLKLRVGVVSVRGNYREHNEDNFFVPGRRSVRHDSGSESNSEMPALTLEPSNLFIVADGMGGQQAGEQASLMAVELIPRAIARRLPPDEKEPEPHQGRDPRRGRRRQSGDPGQLRSDPRVFQHGNDRRARPVSVRSRLRGGHRRLARLSPARRPARTAHQGPLAGRRPARCRHDHRRRAADAQVQERACISTWAARTPAAVPRTSGSSTSVRATGC